MKIYLASPLFTTAEQEFNRALSRALADSGHEIWLPQEHEPRSKTARAISRKTLKDCSGRRSWSRTWTAPILTQAHAGSAATASRKYRSYYSAQISARPEMRPILCST